ncbi:multiubiquitin domain-containing protein [Novilysobacter spongiicola]|uniref:Multiubiquitin n=1 Tax=Lysobacter spongiicola DSM 21749 TaxID=1122188 RepID=A0A1T4RGW5_9GAMM|nr:multiubiquitin domain-containing protein [Lysobacter spongiicola]SKA14891.1 Multiubiquitin [Lysobacter spongiicola DSM 21749]
MNEMSRPPDVAKHTPTVRLNGELVALLDRTPTGEQVLNAAGLRPASAYALLHWPTRGPTREIGLEEVLALPRAGQVLEYFAIRADGVSYFVLDEERYAWAGPLDLDTLMRVGRVDSAVELWQERHDEPDRRVLEGTRVDLDREGVERFYTRKRVWTLEVQGETTQWDNPRVLVRDAIIKAGFDPSKAWTIKFKVKGAPIRDVQQMDTIDLSEPGVERLRVRPSHVDNGDGSKEPRRDFSLLAADATFLATSGYQWHTIVDGQRWLIVDNYPLPAGYNTSTCRLAVDMPLNYPAAQLDMFFCDPALQINGVSPPQTGHRQPINGVVFQRWSRHRGAGSAWCPGVDNLASHFALIEHSIGREVGA